jgi:hypothetical protein
MAERVPEASSICVDGIRTAQNDPLQTFANAWRRHTSRITRIAILFHYEPPRVFWRPPGLSQAAIGN